MLPLFKFLQRYDHEYHIFWDSKFWPWGDKSTLLKEERLGVALKYLDDKVDMIIVDSITELQASSFTLQADILPLFQTYIKDYVLKYSLVGKLGLLCDHVDMEDAQSLLEPTIKEHILTNNQKNIKKFHQDFPMWRKEVRMWKYFLSTYGARNPMLRKTIKHDLRYFHDAAVDTIIPMSWGFLFYDKIIQSKVNWKKIRFHGLDVVQDCFKKIVKNDKLKATSYSVTLHYTDSIDILLQEKKWMWLLERGKEIKIEVKYIDI